MRITREAEYALRIVLMLSGEKKQVEAKVIAESNGIPYRFTLKILRKIVQAGIIRSYRGVNGGYVLNCEPSEVSMLDVIKCIDGGITLNRCEEQECTCKSCSECMINLRLNEVQSRIEDELASITFDKMLSKEQIYDTCRH